MTRGRGGVHLGAWGGRKRMLSGLTVGYARMLCREGRRFPGGTSGGSSILLVVLCLARLCSGQTMLNASYSLAFSHLCRCVRHGAPMVGMTEFAS